MSTVDSFALLSAITIGYDVIGRHFKKTPKVLLIKLGLAVTAMISIVLAIAVPSVINLWLLIGNIFIPPMLLPLVACYYPRINPGRPWVIANLTLSFAAAFGWLLISIAQSPALNELYFFQNMPPMYPGLLVSVSIFIAGVLQSRR